MDSGADHRLFIIDDNSLQGIQLLMIESDAPSMLVTPTTDTTSLQHNSLLGLQGGNGSDQYYHLDQNTYAAAKLASSPSSSNVFATMSDVGSGGSVTVSNGITQFEDSSIGLGGSLIQDTMIDVLDKQFLLQGESDTDSFYTLFSSSGINFNITNNVNVLAANFFSDSVALRVTDVVSNNIIGLFISADSGSPGIIIEDDIYNIGIAYAGDYSSNYTNRSLVDKEYVSNTFLPINGIVNSSSVVDYQSNSLTIQGENGSNEYFQLAANAETGESVFSIIVGTSNISPEESQLSITNIGWFLSYNNAEGTGTFTIQSSGVIGDTINNTGLYYEDNYSANYTDRSLVDKAYVDSHSVSYTFQDGLIDEGSGVIGLGGSLSNVININMPPQTYFSINGSGDGTGTGYNGDFAFSLITADNTLGNPVSLFVFMNDDSGNEAGLNIHTDSFQLSAGQGGGMYIATDSETGFQIGDTQFNIGLKYVSDYSANFTDLSLVSKNYVDTAIAAAIAAL